MKQPSLSSLLVAMLLLVSPACGHAQQVVQRGPLGKPAQVLDETGQWTAPLKVASDSAVQIYIPDVSSPDWLRQNYAEYQDRGTFVLSLFTFYKTPDACRANQTAWGLGDAAHLNACLSVGYRVRRVRIDIPNKSVVLLEAAMTDQNGNVDPALIEKRTAFRTWDQLDANSQEALKKANAAVEAQMKIYADRQNQLR